MRASLSPVLVLAFALSACDQLNKPMPVPSSGTSGSSSGGPPRPADAGTEPLPALPGNGVSPQPGDVQL